MYNEEQNNSIYSDVCENEAELEQIYKNSFIRKKEKQKTDNKKEINSSRMKLCSKESLNEKLNLGIIDNKKEKYSVTEYKSCYEEKIVVANNDGYNNLNIDKEIPILDNYEMRKYFDLSTINSNSNNKNDFLDENTELDLDNIFEINFDIKSKKDEKQEYKKLLKNNNKIKNSISLYENHNYNNLNNNSKNLIVNLPATANNKTFTSLSTKNGFFEYNKKRNNTDINCKKIFEENLMINKINFKDIKKDEINQEYFNSAFKTLSINNNNINNPKNKHLKKLYELQDFIAEDSSPTVIKIDEEVKYLNVGFKNGVIKIYEIINYSYEKHKLFYDKNNIKEYFNFIDETPFKILNSHQNKIIDLFWLLSSNRFFLSASLNSVILWDLKSSNNNHIIKNYNYSKSLTCLSLNPIIQNMFAIGCIDKYIRIYSIDKSLLDNNLRTQKYNVNKELIEFEIKYKIISISFLQEGDKIAIGTDKGKLLIYSIIPEVNFEYRIKFKNGFQKPTITNIIFLSYSYCIISSFDSRIRLIDIKERKITHKYKGHKNEKKNLKIGVDLCNDAIISGSENGYCYLWNIFNKENNDIKNYSHEYFKPFNSNDPINVSLILTEKCYVNYYKKILKITNKIILESIIISANEKGRIKIFLNVNDS